MASNLPDNERLLREAQEHVGSARRMIEEHERIIRHSQELIAHSQRLLAEINARHKT